MSHSDRTTIVPGPTPSTPAVQVARVKQRIALAGMAFSSEAGEAGVTGVFHTQARHLAFLPAETLELDLLDPAERAFGDYELVEKIGQGGMGVVYRARQTSLDREVAIKLLSAGPWASPEFIERFKREAQSAARMQHPNIVSIFEIGTHAELNYFSMQLVRGPSLAQVLAEKGPMAARDAARLLRTIAEAVDYAHRLGVLHLDLKPGNVLVDERGEPQVADFGLARRLDETLATEGEEISGTPSYMAPEQAQLRSHKLSPATDIYGLGAILYELLTGKPPFLGPTAQETLKRVVSLPPERPRSLKRSIPVDLEAICLKCLEKLPKHRYDSARSLADDFGRFLDGRQVSARALNLIQRGYRWARREPRVAAIGSAFILATIVGLGATAVQSREAQAQAQRALAAEAATRQRADELAQVSAFQAEMLSQVEPAQAGRLLAEAVLARFSAALSKSGIPESRRKEQIESFGRDWSQVNATDTARDLIDSTILAPAVGAIDRQFKDQPLVAATLQQVVGERYRQYGLYDAATPLQERALRIRRESLGSEHPDTLSSVKAMGDLLLDQGKVADAEVLYREALVGRTRVLGAEHIDTLNSATNLASALMDADKLDEAEPYLRAALASRRRTLGEEHPDTLQSINHLGFYYSVSGDLVEAERYFREALEKDRRVMGEDHPWTLQQLHNVGYVLEVQGKSAEADPYFRAALEGRRHVLGEMHPDTLQSIDNMASHLRTIGKVDEAEPFAREALNKKRSVLGNDHPETLIAINNVGSLLRKMGRTSEALPYFVEAVETSSRISGKDHRNTIAFGLNLGAAYVDLDRFVDALNLLSPLVEPSRATFAGADAWRIGFILTSVGRARTGLGEFASAEAALVEAHTVLADNPGPNIEFKRRCIEAMVALYIALDRTDGVMDDEVRLAQLRLELNALDSDD